jgi:hypothetical protein
MKLQDAMADAVLATRDAVHVFLPGFTESNRTQTAEHMPNHLMWTLGHISFYLHRVAGELDGRPMPEQDFAAGGASATRFDPEAVMKGSRVGGEYPSLARGLEVLEAATQRLADATRAASDAALEHTVTWSGKEVPLRKIVMRIVFHVGMHTGQIADLRRALGLGRGLG